MGRRRQGVGEGGGREGWRARREGEEGGTRGTPSWKRVGSPAH